MAQARLCGPMDCFQLPDGRMQEDFKVTFFGTGVSLDLRDNISVIYDPTGLSAAQLGTEYRTKCTDAALAAATARGLTVARADVYLPSVQKGL
jgi:hypothetical protein